MRTLSEYRSLLVEAIKIIRLYKNWPEIIGNHFRRGKTTTEVVLRSGEKYRIHPLGMGADNEVIRDIHINNTYQIQKGDIGDNSVVIDIGAHIGVFSVFAARQARNVTVYSFEPEPENFQLLLANRELNHLESSIHAHNQAVSSTAAPRELIRSAAWVSAHSLSPAKFAEGEIRDSVEVDCTTLSDILRKYKISKCDILKLDCEGEEYNILLNAPDTVLSKVVKIVAEYHDGLSEYTHEDMEEFLEGKNFEVQTKKSATFATFDTGLLYAANKRFKRQ